MDHSNLWHLRIFRNVFPKKSIFRDFEVRFFALTEISFWGDWHWLGVKPQGRPQVERDLRRVTDPFPSLRWRKSHFSRFFSKKWDFRHLGDENLSVTPRGGPVRLCGLPWGFTPNWSPSQIYGNRIRKIWSFWPKASYLRPLLTPYCNFDYWAQITKPNYWTPSTNNNYWLPSSNYWVLSQITDYREQITERWA